MPEADTKPKLSPLLAGIAGEYFVAAELSRRGGVASITLRNTRGIDILASNADATKSVGIQVKTSQHGKTDWLLSDKVEKDDASNLFYVFVLLNDKKLPSYYIVPKDKVKRFCSTEHEKWLGTPGRNGQARNRTSMRRFSDVNDDYLNKWELLGLGLDV